MGVKDLWNILSPLCDRKPLFELQGKTIAIDLSCWVVDSQTVADNSVQPKMYLRNLYFRSAFLLMQGISPVFVLEGKAPALKHNTIAKRNDVRNGFRERKKTQKGGRSQFNRILNECKEMLKYMGLVCVQGHGEAEAMCAYLNEDGLVDGCISQDSDCFLYGAKVVYRNFCTSGQGNRGGTGGAVDEYNIEKVEKLLNLGRNKMIVLALLCGCDYDEGLNGVGKEAAMKFFKTVDDAHVIGRIKSWRTSNSLDKQEAQLTCPNICTSCGHTGKVQKHARSGCTDCGTITKCNDSYKEKRALILNEISLRKKALLSENFPNEELLQEFLTRKDPVPTKLDLQWRQPDITKFIDFMDKQLSWEPQYAFEKIFPLVTRWQLLHLPTISLDSRLLIPDLFIPEKIKKIRNIRSVASYEIIWKSDHSIIARLKEYETSDDDNNGISDNPAELTSIEPQPAILNCYPELVKAFETARNAKAKKRPIKSKAKKPEKDDTEVTDEAKKKQGERRGGRRGRRSRVNKKLDEFIDANKPLSLEQSFEQMTITPKRSKRENVVSKAYAAESIDKCENQTESVVTMKRGPQFDKVLHLERTSTRLNSTLDRMFDELSPDDFVSDNDNDLNMTDIIENICSVRTYRVDTGKHIESCKIRSGSVADLLEDGKSTDATEVLPNIETNSEQRKNDNTILEDSLDEFGNISESYVPINQRVLKCDTKLGVNRTSQKGRFSFAFDMLMEDTVLEGVNT